MTPASPGSILAVGGAEDKVSKRDILERFVREAGGSRARIAILPTASSIPHERGAFYRELFASLGAQESFPVPIVSRRDADARKNAEAIESASGVFLTGGDQSRLVGALAESRALGSIERRLEDGGVLCGTSAGASAFSARMIVGGRTGLKLQRDAVELAPGLGVITRLIIDQHFSQRKRLGRLLTAVALEPERLGVGIDEDTAIVYFGRGEIEVIGSGHVFILDASRAAVEGADPSRREEPLSVSGVMLHVLTRGRRFDVLKRRAIA
jgi:cyanophycinase